MDQQGLCTVRSKIKCIFEIDVNFEKSAELKLSKKYFYVSASETFRNEFLLKKKEGCLPTEKIDGTSTIIKKYNDKAWLWVRRDRKLKKQAAAKKIENEETFVFDIDNYKIVPEDWIAGESYIDDKTGQLVPDKQGEIMGWIPLDSDKMHKWHAETVDYDNNRILVLNVLKENDELTFELNLDLLSDHEGQSFELIGTNINGNPYKIGTKKCPIHFLILHGCIPVCNFLKGDFNYESITNWFVNEEENNRGMEGIVWHCSDGDMFKLTMPHLKLKWPTENTKLNTRPILINITNTDTSNKYINRLLRLNGQSFKSLSVFSNCFIINYYEQTF